jgi:hypothetical protein
LTLSRWVSIAIAASASQLDNMHVLKAC